MREWAWCISTLISTCSHICPHSCQIFSESVSKMSQVLWKKVGSSLLRCISFLSWSGRVWGSDTAEHLITSLTWSTFVMASLSWNFSALGKAPDFPWAVACLTARVFSAVELCLCSSVRLKNESNLKICSGWHLPFGWPGSAERAIGHGMTRAQLPLHAPGWGCAGRGVHQAGKEMASGTTREKCRGNLALWGSRGRESHMDLCRRMRWFL